MHRKPTHKVKNIWHKMACSTAAAEFVMKMITDVGANAATSSPPNESPSTKKQALTQIVSVPTVSKNSRAATPSL